MTKNKQTFNAFTLCFVCIFTYMISYFARKLINVYAPNMKASGLFDEVNIATLSSVYMYVYACGQLVNGFIGDYVKPKFMVLIGLLLGAIACLTFTFFDIYPLRIAMFALLGYGFSMLRGPIVKLISENTKPNQSRIACVFLSFIGFAGPLLAGLFVIFFDWKTAYLVSGIGCALFAVICYVVIGIFEKIGFVKPIQSNEKKSKIDLLGVFKLDRFLSFVIVVLVTEIICSAIGGWFNLYLVEYLGFTEGQAGVMYSVYSIIGAFCPFASLYFYKLFKHNEASILRVFFIMSAVCFILMNFISQMWVNVALYILGYFFTGIGSSTVWSIYIPSLYNSGKVSSANGVMDFSGYFGAASATFISGYILKGFGWKGMLISWAIFVSVGSLSAFLVKPKKEIE